MQTEKRPASTTTVIGGTMSNEYQLADGSPRYGHRTGPTAGEQTATAETARIEKVAGGAAKLSLDVLAAAMDRRLRSDWADEPDPAVEALRDDNPEELAAARPRAASPGLAAELVYQSTGCPG